MDAAEVALPHRVQSGGALVIVPAMADGRHLQRDGGHCRLLTESK
jgi:hypothetical protein